MILNDIRKKTSKQIKHIQNTQHKHVDERQLHVLHVHIWLNYTHNGFPNYNSGDLPTVSRNMMLQWYV